MATSKNKKTAAPVMTEVATILRDPFAMPYGGIIRPRDETLMTRGGSRGIWIYDDIKRDGVVFSSLEKRILGLLSRPLVIDAADDTPLNAQAAEAIAAHFRRGRINRLTRALCDATLKGFAVVEVLWGVHKGLYLPMQFKARDQRRFVFDVDGNLRMLTRESMLKGEELPPRKFIVHRCGDSDENPYGVGLGTRLFWYALFKRQGLSFWLQFVDKLGLPTTIGKYPAGTVAADRAILQNAVDAVRSSTGVTIPEGMIIEFLELKASGNITTQEQLVRYMDEQIRETVGLEAGGANAGGALAAAAIDRREVRLDIVKADDEEIAETLQSTIVQWIIDVNFPGAEPPELYRDTDEPEDLNARVSRDKTLFDMGYRLTSDGVKDVYGDKYDDVRAEDLARQAQDAQAAEATQRAALAAGAKALPPGKTAQGTAAQAASEQDASTASNVEFAAADTPAFPDQAAVDVALDAMTAQTQQALMTPVLEPILKLMTAAKDPADALGKLADVYPQMDTAQLEALLARMFFVAMIHGQLSVNDELTSDATAG